MFKIKKDSRVRGFKGSKERMAIFPGGADFVSVGHFQDHFFAKGPGGNLQADGHSRGGEAARKRDAGDANQVIDPGKAG